MATLGALSVAHTPTISHPSPPLEFTRFCSVSYSSRYLRSPSSLASSPRSRGCSSERVEVSSSVFENELKGCGYGVRRGRRIQRTLCSPQAQHGREALRIMISGAPASGKGTQCELIVQKYNLTHIAAGDLLRAEVAAGTECGKQAQEYMQQGKLVPIDIVGTMVKNKLLEVAGGQGGWLLDGYPRSLSQAEALDALDIRPDIFILLEVPDEILVQRVVGRRQDPVTGKIYHLMYSPPETPAIAGRLTQRLDDTEEKVKLRLKTHQSNVEAVLGAYKNVIKRWLMAVSGWWDSATYPSLYTLGLLVQVDGNRAKDQVFVDIENLITELQEGKPEKVGAQVASGGL